MDTTTFRRKRSLPAISPRYATMHMTPFSLPTSLPRLILFLLFGGFPSSEGRNVVMYLPVYLDVRWSLSLSKRESYRLRIFMKTDDSGRTAAFIEINFTTGTEMENRSQSSDLVYHSADSADISTPMYDPDVASS